MPQGDGRKLTDREVLERMLETSGGQGPAADWVRAELAKLDEEEKRCSPN